MQQIADHQLSPAAEPKHPRSQHGEQQQAQDRPEDDQEVGQQPGQMIRRLGESVEDWGGGRGPSLGDGMA